MEDPRSPERGSTELLCSYDEERGVVVHRFGVGKCKCRCGEKIIRKPVKRLRMKFGRQAEDSDFT